MTDKILKVGIDSPVQRVYPRESDGYTAQLVCRQIFEPPFDAPLAGQSARPLLFDGPLVEDPDSRGRQVYSARVRKNLRFSDGTPVTAGHVAESLAELEHRGQAEVRAEGDRVLFFLRRPNANFHLALTQTYWALALPRGDGMIGTGAFRMDDSSTSEHVILQRNPEFRSEVPLDGIEFIVYRPDEKGSKAPLIRALENGEIDLTTTLDQTDVSGLGKVRKWFDPGSSTSNLYFNTRRPPFDDPRVRKALAMRINRLDLSAAVYGNALAFAAKGPLPPMMGEWHDDIPYDAHRSAKRLDELGVERPRTMRLLMPWAPRPYIPAPNTVLEQLEQMLGWLGIELVTIPTRDLRDFRRHVLSGEYDLALLGWNADTPDPADFLDASLASGALPEHEDSPVVQANWSRWVNPRMDEALEAFRADPDDPGRYNRDRILGILSEEVPLFPLMHGPTLCVHSYRVRNFEPNPFGIPSLAEVDLWL